MFNNDSGYFHKGDEKPSLFHVKVDKSMYDHLNQNDLDEISKNEVVY